jgi:bifunctional UDP-N-acetylglucosamine pyrophosphorylase/glucosamine-1-phosphate N-acetyltransferase
VSKIAAVILAAGKGVRMKSDVPKALCELSGRPMVGYLLDAAEDCRIKEIAVVGGYRIGLLKKILSSRKIKIIRQDRLLGSADAVKRTENYFKRFKGTIVVLYADTPLIEPATLKAMLRQHHRSRPAVTLLTVKTKDPKDYGRIQRDEYNRICAIVEHADVGRQEAGGVGHGENHEINVGAYCFDAKRLFEGLKKIKKNRKKGEFYLTDIISYFYKNNYPVDSHVTADEDEALGINRKKDLIRAEEILRKRIIADLMEKGVVVKDPSTTHIETDVKIGKGTLIYPFVVIEHGVVIGRGCEVGPFVHLRPGTVLKDNSQVGNFVEVVRSTIGRDSKAKHLSYLGDTSVGKDVNVGAGTIIANFDGKKKNRTIIADKAFIGSGSTIIAPVKIGKAAMTGAGCVVVKGKNVPARTVVVGVPAKPLPRKA